MVANQNPPRAGTFLCREASHILPRHRIQGFETNAAPQFHLFATQRSVWDPG